MKTLQDAWDWYKSARTNLERMQRLGSRHWNDDSLKGTSIRKDERFKHIEADDLKREASIALDPIDDLGILVLFSVFESAVRDYLAGVVKPLTSALEGTILHKVGEDALDGIQYGSFAFNVLEPLKKQKRITAELSEKVNQVRHYRNWVAHGKREPRDPKVINLNADDAFLRLKEFLDTLGIAVEAELADSSEAGQERAD
jgi:hypothetical protein